MKQLAFIALLLAGIVHADIWTPYDGDGTWQGGRQASQQGMTCAYYNQAAKLRWVKKGGDWVDATGGLHGSVPMSSVRVPVSSVAQTVELDATPLLRAPGIILRRTGSAVVRLAMRESDTPPVLTVTMMDGSTRDLTPYADVGMGWAQQSTQACLEYASSSTAVATVSHAVMMAFDVPVDAVSGTLRIVVEHAGGLANLQAYALHVPRPDYSTVPVHEVSADPGTIYHESWDRDGNAKPMDWSQKTKGWRTPDAQWTHDGGMFQNPASRALYWANGDPSPVPAHDGDGAMIQRGSGYLGNGLTWTNSPTRLAHGTELGKVRLSKILGDEIDEAWLTYMVRFENWHSFARCEGGKLPGLTGRTDYCAGSSVSANGYCGWSWRMSYHVMCDQNNPAWGHVIPYAYAYHGLMSGFYGAATELSSDAMIPMGEWACIEQHIRVNTPGQQDGVLDVYVNGKWVGGRGNAYLRGIKPEQGYGNWRLHGQYPAPLGAEVLTDIVGRTLWLDRGRSATGVENPIYTDTSLGIDAVYAAIHNGGVTPVGQLPGGKISQAWLDEMRVSHRRAGCPSRAEAPPAVEVCGDGVDNNLDGKIDEDCAPPPPPAEVCDDGLDNNGDGQIDEGCIPPPPPPTELELAQEALRLAQEALAEAMATIDAMKIQADASAAQIAEIEAAAAEAEERAKAAQQTIQTIRDLVSGQ